jgi:F0F1-type ATP synthase membrane subunit b/b'
MTEKVLAGIGLLICVVLALRMLLGAKRTRRIDTQLAEKAEQARQALKSLPQWRESRDTARREAEQAINRARRKTVERDGNVLRPRFGDKKDD